jgi:hypothetical protein
MQKEGNRLPMFGAKVLARNGNTYNVTFDVSRRPFERVIKTSITFASDTEDERAVPLATPGVITIEDMIAALDRALCFTHDDFTNPTNIKREIIYDDEMTSVPFQSFLERCRAYLRRLDAIVSEAEQKFERDGN